MKVSYDQKSDTLTVVFKESAAVAISDDAKPGAILDSTAPVSWCR